VPGESASDYLRMSIVDPEAYLAPDCPNGPCMEGIMPGDYGNRLTAGQTDTLVDFLLEQKAAPSGGVSPAVIALIIILGMILIVVLVLGLLKVRSKRSDS